MRATYVVNVKEGLSAHQGGLKEGSRLVEIDGKNVEGQPFKVIRKKIAESKLPFVLKVTWIVHLAKQKRINFVKPHNLFSNVVFQNLKKVFLFLSFCRTFDVPQV